MITADETEVELLPKQDEKEIKEVDKQVIDSQLSLPRLSNDIANTRSQGIICLLRDAIDEVHILLEVAQMPRVHIDLAYKTPKERFDTGEADETIYNPRTLQLYDEEYYKEEEYRKVQRDCSWLESVFKTMTHEDDLDSMVTEAKKILADYDQTQEDEADLLKKLERNTDKLNYYKTSILSERDIMSKLIKDYCQTVGALKDEMEDLMAENKIKWRYLNDWEDNREETNLMLIDRKESSFKETSRYYTKEIDKERRIHAEILKFIGIDEQEMKEQIDMWVVRYEKTVEEKDMLIGALRLTKEEQSEKLQKLKIEYERRQEEIVEYLAHKEVLRLEAMELKKKSIAATIIQAWWRGTMFRKCLGPYRKKKPKRGKSGKDKGKGKKK